MSLKIIFIDDTDNWTCFLQKYSYGVRKVCQNLNPSERGYPFISKEIISVMCIAKKKKKPGVALTQFSVTLHYSRKVFYHQFYIHAKSFFLCFIVDELPAFIVIVYIF